jgi:hypothetical protein
MFCFVFKHIIAFTNIYTSMSCLIFKYIIVFTNDSFIIQIKTESCLTELSSLTLHLGFVIFDIIHESDIKL